MNAPWLRLLLILLVGAAALFALYNLFGLNFNMVALLLPPPEVR